MASQGAEASGGSVQKRLSDQRARLLALEYHEPLTVESLTLVERLFADLVTTTESYEDLQQREEQAAAELALSRAQLFPLKKDNARLLRDNNLLHLKVIKTAEEAGTAERSALLLGKRNDAEREEKEILATQKDDRIAELEKQVDELRDKLSGALDDVAGQRATGKSSSLHRELEVSNTLAVHDGKLSAARIVRDGGSRAPEDERLSTLAETLRRKLEEASAVISGLEEEKARLQSQVGSREEEIARLGKQISADGNLNLDKVTLAHAHEANQRIVEQLNDQVDFLNKQLALRESQLHKTQEENEKLVSEPAVAALEADRLRDVARKMEQDNARLREAVDSLEKAASEDKTGPRRTRDGLLPGVGVTGGLDNAAASAAFPTGASGARLETVAVGVDGGSDNGAHTAVLEREKGQLVEALTEAVRERGIVEDSLEKARSETRDLAREVERLKETCQDVEERRLAEVGGADAFARERERVFVDLGQTREEAHELKAEVARLRAETEARVAQANVLGRERDALLGKLRELSEKMRDDAKAAEEIERRQGEEMEAAALRREHEAWERRAAGERLSLASEREEFIAQEARAAQLQRDRAERRAEAAEARAANVANDVKELERALQTEELRARTAEGEAADLRTAVGTVGWDHGDRETVMDYERKLEESEAARERLTDEIERLTGQGSLLGVERTAQQARLDALERERSKLSEHLKARERDMEIVLEQKRSLEAEVARAQRTLSRGAVESASRAQGELVLQARVEEMGEELRSLRSETGELRDRLLDEERRAASARDEADRLATRLSHRDTGLEGLEAEATSLRAELGVARAELMEAEVARSRSEAEGERVRTSAEALESQLGVMKENVADKDQEIRRLKTLARQLEGSRESLKASTDQAHAALRDAELRVGQASASGDAAVRELESQQAEVTQLKDALADLDADRDRLQDTLDQQTERLVELQQEKEQLVLKATQAREKAREEGSRCSELEAALERAERRMKDAEAKSAEGLARIEALSSELSNKSGQLSAAAEDLELMAKENQAVTADLSRLGAEKEDDRRRLGDALHKAATAEQAVRAAQFEKEDILKNYKGLHVEKRRLEAGMDELQLARQRLTKSLAERDTEVSKLRASCNTLEVELQRRAMDLGGAQRQVMEAEDLSEQLLRCGRQMEALAAENRKLDSDHRAQRHHANALLERIRSQQGRSASAGQEVSSLRARLQALEEERNGLSHILGRERSHGTGLEQLIEASRLREASMAAEQRQLLREKQQLEAKAVRLSQELSQARECLADLSSRVSDSRQDSRHPADVVGSLSTSTSVAATSAAAAGAAPTTSAWDRYQPNIDARSQSRGLVEGLENALGGGLFSDIASESSVGASPAPPGGGAREASSTGRQERTPLRTREHGTATATAGGNDDAGSDSVAHGDRRGGRSDRVEHKEEDSVVFDLEDVRGFIRHEGQRLRERVRERRG